MEKHDFFAKQTEMGLALTFDDVVMQTGFSDVPPKDVSVETLFSRNITLKIPVVSAAMDTVTENEMAIAMAMLGGIGVIHRSMTIDEQVREVERVKFHLNGLIEKPIPAQPDETIETLHNRCRHKGYTFDSFPVVDDEGRLQGVLTGNDFKYCTDHTLTVSQVMTSDPVTAQPTISIQDAFALLQSKKHGILPLVDEEKRLCGMYVFSDLKRIMGASLSTCNVDAQNQLRVAAAIGTGSQEIDRAKALVKAGVDAVVIDTAHGHTADMIKTLAYLVTLPTLLADVDIVVGNISRGHAVEKLCQMGGGGIANNSVLIDAFKVGQGPGSICTTRVISGAGRPQLTAVYECGRAAVPHQIPVIADGGIRFSGDIVKAIAAGANCVMLGGMLAGTKEAPGEVIHHEGKLVKVYRGMGSLGAMTASPTGGERYRQGGTPSNKLVPEGVESYVPYRGTVADVLFQCVGGLRAGMGYVGVSTIDELRQKGTFERTTSAGERESHPHDVTIIRDASNYQGSNR